MDKLGLEGSFQPPIDWCVALLKQSKELSKARYRIVPRFIDEESFWSRYFNQLLFLVRDELYRHGVDVPEELL